MLHIKKDLIDIIDYYKNKLPELKFFNLIIGDTFGINDNRKN
jgi:hypothetical protein